MVDRTRRTVLATVGGTVALGLAGCSQNEGAGGTETNGTTTDEMTEGETTEEETTTTETMSDEMANVRVAHMSPDAPNVDVYVDGDPVLTDVPFRTTSDYLELAPGTYTVMITAAGDESTVVFEDDLTVEAADYTVVAAGELADDGEAFEVLVLEDDTSDPGGDSARVRLVHVAPDAPAVDVTSGGTTVFDGAAYGETATQTVPANDYTLEIRPDSDGDDAEVVADYDVSLNGRTAYTVFAAGYLSPDDEPTDESFDLLVEQDASY
ncbi:DUF4397 domain-containing protein [Halorientalis salina]|uniref:DUF4397 domain-containing protein n=1 Tax=Halorientalis salina TaxID=2932266 RepID=UPI0010AC372D|nr:DUF4397 domain-containing protein [Halorientalis salina]